MTIYRTSGTVPKVLSICYPLGLVPLTLDEVITFRTREVLPLHERVDSGTMVLYHPEEGIKIADGDSFTDGFIARSKQTLSQGDISLLEDKFGIWNYVQPRAQCTWSDVQTKGQKVIGEQLLQHVINPDLRKEYTALVKQEIPLFLADYRQLWNATEEHKKTLIGFIGLDKQSELVETMPFPELAHIGAFYSMNDADAQLVFKRL